MDGDLCVCHLKFSNVLLTFCNALLLTQVQRTGIEVVSVQPMAGRRRSLFDSDTEEAHGWF